ncbi:hypothetical protein M422DRAFT_33811 [Sphaerobolus stellatus SS14]|uniref:BZIP domain-containing protein n=1 Tax=Sphaerobolus stellatus (strain SS14) TaxID=990650 RepID=A0A0C9V6S2_SPHS4|nr:hypothetical protein M422DRAFT_33811 [Sphaerobolus stellatus SS14]
MSSKEKRQLRNKISARNFRVRRKGESCFITLHLSYPGTPCFRLCWCILAPHSLCPQ